MKTSEAGLRKLSMFEGTVLTVYMDQAGIPTIGTGHALTASELASGVYAGGITADQAREILRRDVADAEAAITRMVKVNLSQEQFDALVSWTFNLGAGALQSSGLLAKLNAGNYDAVPDEMLRWCKRRDPRTGQLVVDAGLLARRRAEGSIWSSGHDHPQTLALASDAEVADAAQKALGLIFTTEENEDLGPHAGPLRDTLPEIVT